MAVKETPVAEAQPGYLKDLYELTKPRIAFLVLITTYTGMWLASGGLPSLKLTFFALLGIGLASGSSSALNNYIDREIDKVMTRTKNRALPSGRVKPWNAIALGFTLGIISFFLLTYTVNLLTALLAIGTIVFYVVIYTIWLKRTSPLNTDIGGVAGALPPVMGFSAVTGEVSWAAFALFLIMFLWQPPHFWALALTKTEEYRKAKIPMLPVVKGESITKRQMLLYTIALIPASLSLFWLGLVGYLYLAVASILGIIYLYKTLKFIRKKPTDYKESYQLFKYSIIYLCVLFVMMFVDCQNGLI